MKLQSNCHVPLLAPAKGEEYRFHRVIGTGGIGSGIVFVLDGDKTLRRNESRSGKLLPSRDYCKLHIVFHYVAALLNPFANGVEAQTEVSCQKEHVTVLPIGKVGNDQPGKDLTEFMTKTGMDVRGVTVHQSQPTMYAVCIQYPDGDGGNIETSTSASSQVYPDDVDRFFEINRSEDWNFGSELVVALPEVPLETRMHLLQKGRQRKALNVSSCTSSEIVSFGKAGGFKLTDLLAINMDEAAALIGQTDETLETESTITKCIEILREENPSITVTITDGANGSYGYYNGVVEFVPAMKTQVVQTSGAGDAYLAGIMIGYICGLPFHKGTNDAHFGENPLTSCIELGTLLAALSLTSPHSIHETIDARIVWEHANQFSYSKLWQKLFSRA